MPRPSVSDQKSLRARRRAAVLVRGTPSDPTRAALRVPGPATPAQRQASEVRPVGAAAPPLAATRYSRLRPGPPRMSRLATPATLPTAVTCLAGMPTTLRRRSWRPAAAPSSSPPPPRALRAAAAAAGTPSEPAAMPAAIEGTVRASAAVRLALAVITVLHACAD